MSNSARRAALQRQQRRERGDRKTKLKSTNKKRCEGAAVNLRGVSRHIYYCVIVLTDHAQKCPTFTPTL
jgi:hypothetical protein